MLGPYRDLLKHSAIYGVGQVLSRLASFLLLPVYTSYLRPGDYGVIAILDIVGNMLGMLLAIAITAAVNRYHFEEKDEIKQSQVWWTGLTFLVITTTAIVVPLWLCRGTLADLTLGSTVDQGEFYYSLILPTFLFTSLVQLPSSYIRIRKWSGTFLGISLVRLVFNISLNVYFLAALHLGITGILLGNLITEGLNALVLLAILCSNLRAYKFHLPLLGRLINFGGPLIITSLLATLMHEADRFLLRIFLDMDQVGVYSVAYAIGQGVNSLCLLPFTMIWGVLVYEVAQQPDAKQIYVRVFQYSTYVVALVMLGVSLVAKDLLTLMVAPDYLEAATLIPIVCLAYILFSFHEHFRVPVMLAKRTTAILPVVSIAVLTNFGANFVLIPWFGSFGAAWASVITFATYSFYGLWRYRRIDRYNYPFLKCGVLLFGMAASYVAYDWLVYFPGGTSRTLPIAMLIWMVWFLILFWGPIRKLLGARTWPRVKMPLSLQERLW